MNIDIDFVDPISEAYQERLHAFMNLIVAQGLTENRAPIIRFVEANRTAVRKIVLLRYYYRFRNVLLELHSKLINLLF